MNLMKSHGILVSKEEREKKKLQNEFHGAFVSEPEGPPRSKQIMFGSRVAPILSSAGLKSPMIRPSKEPIP